MQWGKKKDDSGWFEPLKAPEEWLTGGWKGGKIAARVTVEEGVKAGLQRECDTAPGQSDSWVILPVARNRLFSALLSNTASVKEENVKGASLLKTIHMVLKVHCLIGRNIKEAVYERIISQLQLVSHVNSPIKQFRLPKEVPCKVIGCFTLWENQIHRQISSWWIHFSLWALGESVDWPGATCKFGRLRFDLNIMSIWFIHGRMEKKTHQLHWEAVGW